MLDFYIQIHPNIKSYHFRFNPHITPEIEALFLTHESDNLPKADLSEAENNQNVNQITEADPSKQMACFKSIPREVKFITVLL